MEKMLENEEVYANYSFVAEVKLFCNIKILRVSEFMQNDPLVEEVNDLT